jgi:hypothetical protein
VKLKADLERADAAHDWPAVGRLLGDLAQALQDGTGDGLLGFLDL